MTEKENDLLAILSLLKNTEDTRYQKDCALSNIGHFFTVYKDENINAMLLNLFEEKFPPIKKYEA
jgi:hypothetical protein